MHTVQPLLLPLVFALPYENQAKVQKWLPGFAGPGVPRGRARARVRAHAPWPGPWVPPGAPGRGDPGPLHYHLPSGTGPLQWTPTYGTHVLATDHGLLSTDCNGMWRVYVLWVGVAPEWFAIQFWTSISLISCHASIESTEFPLCIV